MKRRRRRPRLEEEAVLANLMSQRTKIANHYFVEEFFSAASVRDDRNTMYAEKACLVD
jgi:hypothetical protein